MNNISFQNICFVLQRKMSSLKNTSRKNMKRSGVVKSTIFNVVFYVNRHKLLQKKYKAQALGNFTSSKKTWNYTIISHCKNIEGGRLMNVYGLVQMLHHYLKVLSFCLVFYFAVFDILQTII